METVTLKGSRQKSLPKCGSKLVICVQGWVWLYLLKIFDLPNQTDFLFGCSVVWLHSLVVGKSHNCWKTYPFQMHSLDLQNPIWYQTHLSDTFLQLKSYQKVFRHISVGTGNLVKYQNMRDFLILFSNRTTKLFLLNQSIQKIFKQPISNQTKLIPVCVQT